MRPKIPMRSYYKKVYVLHLSLSSLFKKAVVNNISIRIIPKSKPEG
jgi:hypothetical protein